MSSHLINLTHLSLTLSSASFLQAVAALWDCADGCAALSIAAWMRLRVHGSPQSNGHPSVAHLSNIRAAGCFNTRLRGNIKPCTFAGNLLCVGVNGSGIAERRGGVAGAVSVKLFLGRFSTGTDFWLPVAFGPFARRGAGSFEAARFNLVGG